MQRGPDDYEDHDDFGEFEEGDEFAEAELNCGRYPDARGCSLVGTEYCDWDCPFS